MAHKKKKTGKMKRPHTFSSHGGKDGGGKKTHANPHGKMPSIAHGYSQPEEYGGNDTEVEGVKCNETCS